METHASPRSGESESYRVQLLDLRMAKAERTRRQGSHARRDFEESIPSGKSAADPFLSLAHFFTIHEIFSVLDH